MSDGIKVTKDSIDISKANKDELYLDTDNSFFKLYKSGSGIQHFNGTAAEQHTITISHELNYIPFFLFFMDRNPSSNRRLVGTSESDIISLPNDIQCFLSNSSAFEINIFSGVLGGTPPAGDYGYNYYIYYDRLNSED